MNWLLAGLYPISWTLDSQYFEICASTGKTRQYLWGEGGGTTIDAFLLHVFTKLSR